MYSSDLGSFWSRMKQGVRIATTPQRLMYKTAKAAAKPSFRLATMPHRLAYETAKSAATGAMQAVHGAEADFEGVFFDTVKRIATAHKLAFGVGAAALLGGVGYMLFGKKKRR